MSSEPTLNEVAGSEKDKIEQEPEDLTEYPHGLKLALLLLTLCISVFLVALDNTILDQRLDPAIVWQILLVSSREMGSSFIAQTSSNSECSQVYITAVTLFEVGSAVCGAAPSSNALIVGRAIAGLGSAGIFSGAMIIISHSVPLVKRPAYLGLVQGMYGIASVAGPLMTNNSRAGPLRIRFRGDGEDFAAMCFYINLPVGSITLLFMTFFFKMPPTKQQTPTKTTVWARIKQLDPFGTLTFIPAIVCLLLAMQWGGTKYPWNSGPHYRALRCFSVSFSSRFRLSKHSWSDAGTVPPRILKQRSVWAGSIFAFSLGGGFFLLVYYVPIWLQAVKGVSAVHSGIDTIPMIGSLVFGILSSAVVISSVGFYVPFLYLSTIFMSIGAGLIIHIQKQHKSSTAWAWVSARRSPSSPRRRRFLRRTLPSAQLCPFSCNPLAGALFLSVGANVFTTKLAGGLAARVPGVDPSIVLNAGATSLKSAVDPQYLPIVLEVYNSALMHAFKVGIAMSAVSIVGALTMEWRSVKALKIDDVPANTA
ncbi:major facilitator superfamily domain-containing protein [Mycena amicta]|nr:major facilitator superfamily domain-containing protein [Mycena amicta]